MSDLTSPTPVLDVVIPVHNEQHTVAACVWRLHQHLVQTFPYPFRITVADNASTDSTVLVATGLVAELPGVAVVQLAEKGRGRALKAVWLTSDAPILAYMDVDLSTDLDALWPLVAPLMSGHSDLAIGSRLARGSRVVRGARREVISRAYNLILRGALGARFSDAQCGFKAIRADVAAELLPLVEDTTWFFDTELLVLAQRCGLRIHEVPVDWFDDPDSRVDAVATALDDLRGVRRVRRSLSSGALPVADIAARIGRGTPGGSTWQQLQRFAAVGVASTVVHLGLFAALTASDASAQGANLVALLVATVANTALNRRWTFGIQGGRGAARHQAQGLVVFGITWLMTAGALGLLHLVTTTPATSLQTAVVALATAASTVVRFVAMRSWMFRTPAAVEDGHETAAARHTEVTSRVA
ncbi:bifunctional glycosyltransferase family 2/GtrA family protein [Pedococcus sp. KACC 23699]|uniref:dolichyl-phosphate beta-glucosyltransferase n=1 Tax=Pedococcus sp. KACC 23699 TaxID=3149228 RepID=A0AAU7JZ43_9MICO